MDKNGLTANEYRRLMDKLHRLAYELEYDAGRLQASCPACASKASTVREIYSQLGKLVKGS